MTDTVWIVLIVAAALVLLVFRDRLTSFALEVTGGKNKKVKTSMTAQPPSGAAGPGVSANTMIGVTAIDTTERANIERNTMVGKSTITVRSSGAPAPPDPPAT